MIINGTPLLLVFLVSSGVCSFKASFLDIPFPPTKMFFNKVIFINPFC